MRRFTRFVGRGLKWGTMISTLGFASCILLQIFARLLLPTAPSWTEEAARLFFVLAIGFSAGLALRSGSYVNFDFFYRRMKPTWQRWLVFGIDLLTVLLFTTFTLYAVRFTYIGWEESSPSLKFPMAIPFLGMFLLGSSILVYALAYLYGHWPSGRATEDDVSTR
ncbi:MAG: TRAP transporter small permease subunit [Bacteroidota bacterium]